jgi:hypothetical protein
MRNLIAAVATAIVTIIFIASMLFPVQAKVASWEDIGNWHVFGNSDNGNCYASVQYVTGNMLTVVFAKDESVSIMISGLQVTAGETYKTNVAASTGESGTMDAYAASNDSVVFMDVNQTTIKALVNARGIAIQGVGKFDLTGSKRAMASAWSCFEALNSI